jgi:hypothetical protein
MMKCGFGGGPALQNSKYKACLMILNLMELLSGQVLTITAKLITINKLMARHPAYFPLVPTVIALRTQRSLKKYIKYGTAALGCLRAGEDSAPTFSPQDCNHKNVTWRTGVKGL